MENRIDLDALEAALARYGDHTPLDIKFALPALIAELRELRARVTPEPISDKHKDGNWWLVWDENIGAWCRARWDLGCGQWGEFEGYVWRERTPTHALPLPPAPEAQ